jgi:hypothetical protein
MLSEGMDPKVISKVTKVSLDEIEKLRSKKNNNCSGRIL